MKSATIFKMLLSVFVLLGLVSCGGGSGNDEPAGSSGSSSSSSSGIILTSSSSSSGGLSASSSSSSSSSGSSSWRDVVIDEKHFEYAGIGYQEDQTLSPVGSGTTYHVNPVTGDPNGDGSEEHPWQTLEEVITNKVRTYSDPGRTQIKNDSEVVQAGDTLLLYTGHHGSINMYEMYNTDYITIRAAEGEKPLVRNVTMERVGHWRFDGLYVTTEMDSDKNVTNNRLFQVRSDKNNRILSDHIDVFNCKVYTVWNTQGWSEDDWNTLPHDGINVIAENSNIQNNFVKNVRWGIQYESLDTPIGNVVNNTIVNYAHDGINAYSDNTRIEANLIKNNYVLDWSINHDDAIQTYPGWLAPDNIINDVTIRRNVIINTEDPTQSHQTHLQGIFNSDAERHRWIVEKNLVLVYSSGHGITLYNTYDSIVRNNIVVEQPPADTSTNWMIAHIQADVANNNTVEGNYAHNSPNPDENMFIAHQNLSNSPDITVYEIFEDFDNYDFRLRESYQSILSP